MPYHPLTNFEIYKYYQNEPKFNNLNSVYSRKELSKIKDGTNKKNLDEYESIGTHWIALYVNVENVTYFDSFGVIHIPNKLRNSYKTQILWERSIEYKYMIQ